MKIKLDGIHKNVSEKRILKDISCTILEGMIFIVGDSGAGKSTLLNIIGLLDNYTSGKMQYEQNGEFRDVRDEDSFRAANIGFVFQDSNLINGLTVYENIVLGMSLAGKTPSEQEIDEYLDKFKLSKIRDEKIQVISGGERQRVAIVRALIKDSEIVLADEPTGNLDSKNSDIVFKELKEISKQKTVIVITHNLEKAREYADRIITIKDGEIESDNVLCQNEVTSTTSTGNNQSGKSLPFKYIKVLSLNNIGRFKGKFVTTLMTLGLAFAVILGIISVNYVVNNQINDMNYSYYDADLVNIKSVNYDNMSVEELVMSGSKPFTAEEVEFFSSQEIFAEVVPVADLDIYVSDTFDVVDIKYIELTPFFENRIMGNNIQGSFPKNNNEIILGKDLADSLYDGEALGQKIELEGDYFEAIEFTIVGINNLKNVDGKYNTYISNKAILDVYEKNYRSFIYFAKEIENPDLVSFESSSNGGWTKISEVNKKTIWGVEPQNPNEIGISIDVFTRLYRGLKDVSLDADSITEKHIEEVLSERYYIDANNAYEVKITGIYDTEEVEFIAEDTWIDEILKITPRKLQCYTVDMDAAENFNASEYNSKYSFESYYQERFMFAVRVNDTIKLILLVILVITILLTASMTNSFVKISCADRIYEIGILRSLGASVKDIRRLLMFDNVVLGIFTGVFSNIIYAIFVVVLPKITNLAIQINGMIILICVACVVVSVILCVLTGMIMVNKYAKMKPVDAIRNRI